MPQARQLAAALLAVAAVLAALSVPLSNDYRTAWFRELLNLSHVPLLFALAAALWWCLRRLWLAATIAIIISISAELLQTEVGHRSPSVRDAAWGILGVLAAVVSIQGLRHADTPRRKVVHLAAVGALLAWPLVETLPTFVDAYAIWRRFPVIADFQGRFSARQWLKNQVVIQRVAAQDSRWAGRMEFHPEQHSSAAAVLLPVVQNWSGYQEVCCEFSLAEPARLMLSIRDGKKSKPRPGLYSLVRRYAAGDHHVCIDLAQLAGGGRYRGKAHQEIHQQDTPVDVTTVQSFHLVALRADDAKTLLFKRLYLR